MRTENQQRCLRYPLGGGGKGGGGLGGGGEGGGGLGGGGPEMALN